MASPTPHPSFWKHRFASVWSKELGLPARQCQESPGKVRQWVTPVPCAQAASYLRSRAQGISRLYLQPSGFSLEWCGGWRRDPEASGQRRGVSGPLRPGLAELAVGDGS